MTSRSKSQGNTPLPLSPNLHVQWLTTSGFTGCFQCSKRRIVCDGGEPCQKCQKKGIECSGLGRFRFSDGLARRGKLKGCTIPVARTNTETTFQGQGQRQNANANTIVPPRKIQWKNEQQSSATRAKRKAGKRHTGRPSDVQKDRSLDTVDTRCSSEGINSWITDAALYEPVQASAGLIPPWIPPLSSQVRMLFHHCETILHRYSSKGSS